MIYIAGPFFNKKQLEFIVEIEEACEMAGLEYYSPRSEGVIKDLGPEERAERIGKIYARNLQMLITCSEMIAVIDDHDIGTIFEMGYATYRGAKIVSITNEGHGANVMLSHSCIAHVDKPVQAARCLKGLEYRGFSPETVT